MGGWGGGSENVLSAALAHRNDATLTTLLLYLQTQMMLRGRRPCQPTGLRVRQPESANRKVRVSQQEGASQPTGRLESANRKARVSQPEGASQPTRVAGVRQPGRESDNQDNQVASRTTGREPASQPGHESANQVTSQPTRSRVRQLVASQPTGHKSANQVASQPTSTNQVASQTTRTHAGHEKKRNEMRGGRERT